MSLNERIKNVLSNHMSNVCHKKFCSQGDVEKALEDVMKIVDEERPESYSKKITDATVEESNLDDPHFFGEKGYEKEKDQKRLTKQLWAVFIFLMDGEWHTQQEISEKAGVNITSIRSRLYDLRMPRWGGHVVLSERVKGGNGLWRYKLVPNKESLAYEEYVEIIGVDTEEQSK